MAAAAGVALRPLRRRSEFLRAAKGQRAGRTGFSLQTIASDDVVPGVGFTVTKKVGNSPERNRVKRRLRAAARSCADRFQPRHDYVLIGRREALSLPFATLLGDLRAALVRIHQQKTRPAAQPEPEGTEQTR